MLHMVYPNHFWHTVYSLLSLRAVHSQLQQISRVHPFCAKLVGRTLWAELTVEEGERADDAHHWGVNGSRVITEKGKKKKKQECCKWLYWCIVGIISMLGLQVSMGCLNLKCLRHISASVFCYVLRLVIMAIVAASYNEGIKPGIQVPILIVPLTTWVTIVMSSQVPELWFFSSLNWR